MSEKMRAMLLRLSQLPGRFGRWVLSVNWYLLFSRLLVFIPVIICFGISAGIEILVFQSLLSVLGFENIALFLALALELFKLVVPLIIMSKKEQGASLQNVMVLLLRMTLFVISFACTFIAISNNLVDTNRDTVEQRNEQVRAEVIRSYHAEEKEKQDTVHALIEQKIADKTAAYDIASKQQQLAMLNEQYGQRPNWATYSLIMEMNNAITQAQAALNEELNQIEAERTAQLNELSHAYNDTALQARIDAELSRVNGSSKYDISQNTNITKMIYLIRETFGVTLSYEMIVVVITILICFASEMIIWTGTTSLFTQLEKRYIPKGEAGFTEEYRRRITDGAMTSLPDPDQLDCEQPPLLLSDDTLTSRLSHQKRVEIKRQLKLTEREKRYQYKRELKQLKKRNREANRQI